jgi:hypothetical protein
MLYQHASRFPAWNTDCHPDLHDAHVMQHVAEYMPDPTMACTVAAAIEEAVNERMRS